MKIMSMETLHMHLDNMIADNPDRCDAPVYFIGSDSAGSSFEATEVSFSEATGSVVVSIKLVPAVD